jgi:thiopeptide-type bacteriocin biosynthesis protein
VQRVMAPYRNAGFFVLRTPLLPRRSFFELGSEVADKQRTPGDRLDAELARERRHVLDRLARVRESTPIREALFVASPDLHDAIEQWERGGLGEDAERKAIAALYRYLARMSTRSTPFGLFAGSSIGRLESRSNLGLAGRDEYRRFTLLDNSYLFLLLQEIDADPAYRAVATYRPNSGLYRAGDRLRYAETLVERQAGTMSYQLAAVERDECIDLVLEIARNGTTIPELTLQLAEACGVTPAVAGNYVDGLVDDQILVSELGLAVTGSNPLEDACAHVAVHPDAGLAGALSTVQARLVELDGGGLGAARSRYDAIVGELGRLPVRDIEPSRVFRVDLWKPLAGDALGSQVISDVRAVIAQLHRIAPPLPRTELDRIRDAFWARHGEQPVPLTIALDPDLGIAASQPSIAADATGLLAGLTFDEPEPGDRVEHSSFPDRELFLIARLRDAWRRGDREIILDEQDLVALESPRKADLPPSFAAWFQLARREGAPSDEEYEILFSAAVGPPSTRLLGRFAHGSARLAGLLRELAELEARSEPDAILAEITHLPEGRSGNVVCRPTVREFEIPYLGKSGVPRSQQIAVDDLWLRVAQGRFELWSRSLGRRVIPRLSCAHNTAKNSAPLYRFLAQLQFQDCHAWLKWTWGPFLHAAHLPRVRIGPVIVSRETWNLGRADLEPLVERAPAARYRHACALREGHQLPRFISLADGDNELPIDLENPVSLDVFADMVKARPRACLVELWPGQDGAGVEGPEGSYANEVILPFVRTAERQTRARPPAPVPHISAPDDRWLRSRLLTSRSSVDPILTDVLAGEMASLARDGACDLWHFQIEHAAGQWQIALDLLGEPEQLASVAMARLGCAFAPLLADGQLRAWMIESHAAETARYGGEQALREAHALMAHDSAAAVQLIAELLTDGDEEQRWKLALMSVHRLLCDLAPAADERSSAVDLLRTARLASLPVGGQIEAELARTYRSHRDEAAALLDGGGGGALEDSAGSILAARSHRLAPACSRLQSLRHDGGLTCEWPVLVAHLAEDAARRLLRPATAAHELVIYDILRRACRSEEARMRRGIQTATPTGDGARTRRAAP